MTTTATDIESVRRLTGREAERIGLAANAALIDDLRRLGSAEWEMSTVCDPWTVVDIVRHVVGAAKANASLREMARQQIHGMRQKAKFGNNALDAANDLQVRDHRHLDPSELIDELETVAPKSVRRRVRNARLLGGLSIPLDSGGSTAAGMPTSINMGNLLEVIYTRDVWLHRVDIARASGRALSLNPQDDGRIVEDVVKEWADVHGEPFDLQLNGPAGGHYRRTGGGPTLVLDAVDFCWILSGREAVPAASDGQSLLSQRIVF